MRDYSYDLIGDIVVFKFSEDKKFSLVAKKKISVRFLKGHKNVQGVFEKVGKISGRLRKQSLRFLAGEKDKETVYSENGCRFKLDIEEVYFSPRLANHRKEVAEKISRKFKNGQKILVGFAGVAPFSIVISKELQKKKKDFLVVSNEINRNASKYAEENVVLNKVFDNVKVVQGDFKKLGERLKGKKLPVKYDYIVMARPNLKDSFLKEALGFAKKGTRFYYHGFGLREEVLEKIKADVGSRIKNIKISEAGEIAPYKHRWLVEFEGK